MDLQLSGRVALVTGASRGLGLACARQLSAEGARVAICSRSEERVSRAAEGLRSNSIVHPFRADVCEDADRRRLVTQVEREVGAIDILVVSLAHPPTLPFSEAGPEEWEQGRRLLLEPQIGLSKLVIDGMRERRYGRIIFVGSIFGREPEPSSVIQSTLRTGLNALAKCMSTEVAADGVNVNVVCPGYFDTPLVRELAEQYARREQVSVEAIRGRWKAASPADAFGDPDHLGALVAFLASPLAAFIQGTAITIDGGAVRSP